MKSIFKNLDTIQLVGFALSVIVSITLILAGNDSIPSATLGFVLAILTQLLDIQKRQNDSEEKILRANTLSVELYKDEWLLRQIQQTVDSYIDVKQLGFSLFETRANDAVTECHNVLYQLADGYLVVPSRSPYSPRSKGIEGANKSIKAVAIADFSYWKTNYAHSYIGANKDALARGVKIVRVFIANKETIEGISDILKNQKELGIEVYTAVIDEVPPQLIEDSLIIDDKVFSRGELTSEGKIRELRLTIDLIEVQQAVTRFDALLRHSDQI